MSAADYRLTRVRDGVYRVTVDMLGLDGPFERSGTITTLTQDDALSEPERLERIKNQAQYAANKLRERSE